MSQHRTTLADVRTDLREFVRFMFYVTRGRALIDAPHHETICNALAGVLMGRTKRLIISVPPRSGKTLLASQMFPAFWMGLNPASQFILTSYSHTLAADNTYAIREIMRHEIYQALWHDTRPAISDDSAARDKFRTKAGGMVYGVGAGGTITGVGAGGMGDTPAGAIIIDDISKPDEARSDTMRANVLRWFSNTLESRKNSPDTPIIIIGQRLHERDLSGWLLDGGNGEEWELVKIPALQDGESFWPRQFPVGMLERLQAANPYVFAGQYQQEPAPADGALFKPEAIETIDALPTGNIKWARGWDLASVTDGDYTAGAKLGRLADGRYVIADMVRLRAGPDERDRAMLNTASADGRGVLVSIPQDPGQAGKTQAMYLARQFAGYKVRTSTESGSKETRAEPFASQVNAGNVLMIRGSWNDALINEMRMFPNGAYDDQIDALSRAFGELFTAPGKPQIMVHDPGIRNRIGGW